MPQKLNKSGRTNRDLADELKLDTKRLIEEVRREGVDISIPSNSVSRALAEMIRNKYFPKKETAVNDTVADDAHSELMKEALRRAEEIRLSLEGRQHSDSTDLIAEDRKR